jgi:glutathione-regulated potassium-efflux system ancillary protein KefF
MVAAACPSRPSANPHPSPPVARIVVLSAHPHLEHSRVTLALAHAATSDALPQIELRDLYALYPDYLIDVAAEQAALADTELLVWLHPVHWYGMTPLLKLWADEVLAFGWAYGPGGTALRGKDLWLVTSTGGSAEAYRPDGLNRYFFDAFLPPYEQTAQLVGLRFLPPLVLHGAHRLSKSEIDAHVQTFASRLASYPDWPEIEDLPACEAPEVPAGDRPSEAG